LWPPEAVKLDQTRRRFLGRQPLCGTGVWSSTAVTRRPLAVDLMIEREAGSDRVGDMRAARERVERELERRTVRA
jgi:hypothetical protein